MFSDNQVSQPSETHSTKDPTLKLYHHGLAILVIVLSFLTSGLIAKHLLSGFLYTSFLHNTLDQAKNEIISKDSEKRKGNQNIRMPDGSTHSLQPNLKTSPRAIVNQALNLENGRVRCERLLAEIETRISESSGKTSASSGEKTTQKLARLWDKAQTIVSEALGVNRQQARLVLAALSWPPLGPFNDKRQNELPELHKIPPEPLASMDVSARQRLQEAVQANSPKSWPSKTDDSARGRGFEEADIRAIEGWLCRTMANRAFRSSHDTRRAHKWLARHAAITSFQIEWVMAIRAVQHLLEGGSDAFPVLIALTRQHPAAGIKLLHRAVILNGIQRQAHAAVQRFLKRPGDSGEVVKRLGPFALEAIHNMSNVNTQELSPRQWDIISQIRDEWPDGSTALDILGDDPAKWDRWYKKAHSIL